MRIPTEHFSHVPVVLLSPGLLLSPTSSEPDSGKNSWLRPSGAIGSAPASPAARRRDFALRSGTPSSPLVTPSALSTADSTPTSYVKSEYPHSSEKRSVFCSSFTLIKSNCSGKTIMVVNFEFIISNSK